MSDRAIEVSSVELPDVDAERFVARGVDRPAPGAVAGGRYELDVRGWALGRGGSIEHVELSSAGVVLRRTPLYVERADVAAANPEAAGALGFYATLGATRLPREFALELHAIFADGTRAALATVHGRRPSVESAFEPTLMPVMVTSPGRTGSTVLMEMLASHPEVIAYPPFEHEARVATFWIDVLKELTDPWTYLLQVMPEGNLNERWWLRGSERLPRRLSRPDLQAWLGGAAVEEIAAFCQSRIDSLYSELAAQSGRAGAKVFAEKFRPDDVPALMWELYSEAREIVLMRDPRDIACSVFASSAKRGVMDLSADRHRYVADDLRVRIAAAVPAWQARRDRAHLVRYEDLMLDGARTLTSLLEYAGLDASEHTVEAMLSSASGGLDAMEAHRTTPDPVSSIGRWRRDLTPELQGICEEAFRPALDAFGYAD